MMKKNLPEKFEARIGGVLGMSFSAILTAEGIEYTEFADQFTPLAKKLILPDPAQWQAFANELDAVAVWDWNPEYLNQQVRDGTSWEFECQWGRHKIKTGGSNAFPANNDPRQTAREAESRRFDELLRAISQLLGGMPFE